MKFDESEPKVIKFIRSGHAADMVVNIAFPYLVYSLAEPSMGRVHALMASAIPPIIWSLIELICKRRLDVLSMIVLGGIALSLLAFLGGGGYRMLQLREHLVPAVTAVIFIGSVLIKRPIFVALMRAAAKRVSQEDAEKLERELKSERVVRLLGRLTLGFGLFMLIQVAIAVTLIFVLPIKEFLIVSPIVAYVMIGLLLAGLLYFKPKLVAVFKGAVEGQPEASG